MFFFLARNFQKQPGRHLLILWSSIVTVNNPVFFSSGFYWHIFSCFLCSCFRFGFHLRFYQPSTWTLTFYVIGRPHTSELIFIWFYPSLSLTTLVESSLDICRPTFTNFLPTKGTPDDEAPRLVRGITTAPHLNLTAVLTVNPYINSSILLRYDYQAPEMISQGRWFFTSSTF